MSTRPAHSFKFMLVVSLAALIALIGLNKALAENQEIKLGEKAPDFTLPAQDGTSVSLHDFAGKQNVVLFFYPKDNSLVCTKEVCSFRDSFQSFSDAGAAVLGVSSDSEKSHEDFAAHNKLPYKLLSDEHGKVRKLYGIPTSMGVLPGRVTYVIDKAGTVRLLFNSQLDAQKHVTEALKVLKDLENGKQQG